MTDFKIGQKVQMDPALTMPGGSREPLGTGTVENVWDGGMTVVVRWAGTAYGISYQDWELVPVAEDSREDH